ncbi:MAG: hypothetical protein AAF363_19600 [Bacteroidota bacterium]
MEREQFNWRIWDQVRNKYHKIALLDSINKTYKLNLYEATEENHQDFKFIDLNADQLTDLAFIDKRSETSPKTVFFLNALNHYEKLLELNGELIYVNRQRPWSPVSFELIKSENGHSKEEVIETYAYVFKDGTLAYEITGQYLIRKKMKLIKENIPPRLFEVPAKGVLIRTHPDPHHGQKIKKYSEGKTGYAIASQLNKSGNIWWLVMLKEESEKFRLGWMNSSDLKEL